MKINKIGPKFHFFYKNRNKNDPLCVFVLIFYCLFASRVIWKPFYRRLSFLVVLTIRNIFHRPLSRGGHFISRDLISFVHARLAS